MGAQLAAKTGPLWPNSCVKQSPLSAHQSLAVRSVLQVASSWPSGEKQHHITWSSWPSKSCRRSPGTHDSHVERSHTKYADMYKSFEMMFERRDHLR